ncbi:toxin-antitoxin system YwqK family antitoxin [Tepidamorphus sp. 3E244]|uniref:toxin-antitoxin system YwqK family antitoxin n=1 Tax=Tepidamorphus sp. 3E244 TaxID=3385498 RepID=UPI0038FCB3F9
MSDPEPFEKTHRDGSLWARGQVIGDVPTGYWEWFRKDGTKLRSGHFEDGEQVGEWTTYDRNGAVYKVTRMRARKDR